MDLRHKISMKLPDIKKELDENTRSVFTQMVKEINDKFKNIYDDLIRIAPERVTELPTASSEILGRFYLKINDGASDTYHICVYDDSDSSYKFQQVTLS